jgi:hypothetical protein
MKPQDCGFLEIRQNFPKLIFGGKVGVNKKEGDSR